ncbi:MAG: FAD-binding protein [Candidatus Freyarchaeota archaeon]
MGEAEGMCDRSLKVDLLVVGSEGAGGHAAVEARSRGVDVLVVTKGRISQCGASQMAGADFNVDGQSAKALGFPGDDRDSPERFVEDIVREGLYLSNQKMVEKYVEYAPKSLKDLLDWGMRVYGYESAHAEEMARGVTTSGVLWVKAIRRRVRELGIPVMEDTMVVDLLTSGGRVAGAVALDMKKGETVLIRSKAVILATGGWQAAYPFNTAPSDLTGDGVAMAYRAGAELISMEMVQFCPLTLVWPPKDRGSICLYVFSSLEVGRVIRLLNSKGERFMERYDPRNLEQSTKEIVSIASELEVEAGRGGPHGGVFFSLRHLGAETIDFIVQAVKKRVREELRETRYEFTTLLPQLLERCKTEDIEVGNAAHYMCGGIKVNERTETSIPGLFAAGECSGGLWGAARVASACTEAGAQGKLAGEVASEYVEKVDYADVDAGQVEAILKRVFKPLERGGGVTPNELQGRMHTVSGGKLGVIKDGAALREAVSELERMLKRDVEELYVSSTKTRVLNYEWARSLELRNMLTCLYLSARSSLIREESRGEFYRRDCPYTDNDNWLKNIVVRMRDGECEVWFEKPVVTRVPLPSGRLTYQEAIGVATASLKRD